MEFDKARYTNPLQAPSRLDYTMILVYDPTQKCEVSLVKRQYRLNQGRVMYNGYMCPFLSETEDREAYKIALDAYRAEETRITQLFVKDLFENENLPIDDFSKMLYGKCYQDHHSSGLEEIWNCMGEYTEIYLMAQEFFMKTFLVKSRTRHL